jgi:hypothetical protein
MRPISNFKNFNAPDIGFAKYEAKRAKPGISILAVNGISWFIKIADHVKARKPRNKTADIRPKNLLIIALPIMKFIAPVKMDIANLTGKKMIFNGIFNIVGIIIIIHPFFLFVTEILFRQAAFVFSKTACRSAFNA